MQLQSVLHFGWNGVSLGVHWALGKWSLTVWAHEYACARIPTEILPKTDHIADSNSEIWNLISSLWSIAQNWKCECSLCIYPLQWPWMAHRACSLIFKHNGYIHAMCYAIARCSYFITLTLKFVFISILFASMLLHYFRKRPHVMLASNYLLYK